MFILTEKSSSSDSDRSSRRNRSRDNSRSRSRDSSVKRSNDDPSVTAETVEYTTPTRQRQEAPPSTGLTADVQQDRGLSSTQADTAQNKTTAAENSKSTSSSDSTSQKPPPTTSEATKPERVLSGEVLNVIGPRIATERVLEPPVHSSFAVRWAEIIKLGLPTEEKDVLVKKYPPPENCTFLDPPKLNVQVQRALNEQSRLRDKRISDKHEKLVACTSGIAKSLSILLRKEANEDVPIIECLSDVCRLLTDSIHDETQIRRNLVLHSVDASTKETLTSTTPDQQLFGSQLTENLKDAEIINQSVEKLKKKQPPSRTPKNYAGPSRQTNKNYSRISSGPKQTISRPRSQGAREPEQPKRSQSGSKPQHKRYYSKKS